MSAIHPAPDGFTAEQLTTDPILRYFHFAHLPQPLQTTSVKFYELASFIIAMLPRNPERTVALRKLLEAKDAAVRSNVEGGHKIAETFLDRLRAEHKELSARVEKLSEFIDGSGFAALPLAQRNLLIEQRAHMDNYRSVLEQRLDDLGSAGGGVRGSQVDVGDRDEVFDARTTGGGSNETPIPFDD